MAGFGIGSLFRRGASEYAPSTLQMLLMSERNDAWRKLNDTLFQLAILQCQHQANPTGFKTAVSGAYCNRKTPHFTDKGLVKYLRKLLKGKVVASFGDGNGVYKRLLDASVKRYDAYDGAWFSMADSQYTMRFLDLSTPIYGLPDDYHTVISLEVAEHIPRQFERHYIDNIVRYAQHAVILSWAVLGQGGYAHVNERTAEYVKDQMLIRGFHHNQLLSEQLKSGSKFGHIQRNINYFERH